ncbi:hypothetical protein, partial [Marinimicrococcus flavescens]|nr:hypothetical protein [Marinimicrococcus flavescens]
TGKRLYMTKQEKMDEVFGSFEYHLFEKLTAADQFMARITSEARMLGVDQGYISQYMGERVLDMIDQIAEKREAEDGRKNKKKGRAR